VPFHRGREQTFEALPILTRRDLQDHGPRRCSAPAFPSASAGDTPSAPRARPARPVKVVTHRPRADLLARALTNARPSLATGRDLEGTLCAIPARWRARPRGAPRAKIVRKGWGRGHGRPRWARGKMAMISLATDHQPPGRSWLVGPTTRTTCSATRRNLVALAEHFQEARGSRCRGFARKCAASARR